MDLSYHWRIFFISTHALTEGDAQNIYDSISAGHFNSRPHGGRQRTRADDNTGGVFQLTPSRRATTLMTFSEKSISFQLTPSRRATLVPYNDFEEKVFQLTPSRRATINPAITLATTLFQLTPSRRATINHDPDAILMHISTHALTEGDGEFQDISNMVDISTHALTEGDF